MMFKELFSTFMLGTLVLASPTAQPFPTIINSSFTARATDQGGPCIQEGVCMSSDSGYYMMCASGYWQRMQGGSYLCTNGILRVEPFPNRTEATGTPTMLPTPLGTDSIVGSASATASTSRKSNAQPSPKRLVTYVDTWRNWHNIPAVNETGIYNVIILAFLMSSGPTDVVQLWQGLTPDIRTSDLEAYHNAGKLLMVAAFGDTDSNLSGMDPWLLASNISTFVNDNKLDGVDVNFEDFNCFNSNPEVCIDWIVTLVEELHAKLARAIITLAPVAPWFSTHSYNGAWLKIHERIKDKVAWYNIQYYNQGVNSYTDCNSLFTDTESRSNLTSQTSVAALIAAGVEPGKIVVGKPSTPSDALNGYVDANTLAQYLREFPGTRDLGGLMTWQLKNDTSWISNAFKGFGG